MGDSVHFHDKYYDNFVRRFMYKILKKGTVMSWSFQPKFCTVKEKKLTTIFFGRTFLNRNKLNNVNTFIDVFLLERDFDYHIENINFGKIIFIKHGQLGV